MRFSLRTLLLALLLLPPVLAKTWPILRQAYWEWQWREAKAMANQVQTHGGGTISTPKN